MINSYSYPQEFKDLLTKIKTKYGEELFELDGIGQQLDVNEFSKKFFNKSNVKTTSDVSVDGNANVEDVTLMQYNSEIF